MDSFEWNKVAASLLVGALLYMVISISSESFFHVEAPEQTAYAIAVPEEGASAAVAEEVVADEPSLAELLVAASADSGARIFRQCQTCHSIDAGGANKTGPNLYGIMGSHKAHLDSFGYSDAMANAGGEWTYEDMDAWLASPSAFIPGNKMSFAGIRRANQRADLIAYLRAQSDNPLPLPEVVMEAAEQVMDAVEGAAEEAGN